MAWSLGAARADLHNYDPTRDRTDIGSGDGPIVCDPPDVAALLELKLREPTTLDEFLEWLRHCTLASFQCTLLANSAARKWLLSLSTYTVMSTLASFVRMLEMVAAAHKEWGVGMSTDLIPLIIELVGMRCNNAVKKATDKEKSDLMKARKKEEEMAGDFSHDFTGTRLFFLLLLLRAHRLAPVLTTPTPPSAPLPSLYRR
jgi:hypothetical protein